MSDIVNNEDIQKWKYHVDEIAVITTEETINIPYERLTRMTIENNYEGNSYPIMSITLALEATTYYKIIKNKKDAKVKLRVQKYYRYIGEEEKSLNRDFINGTYGLILDDNDVDSSDSLRRASSSSYDNITVNEKDDPSKIRNNVTFYLFNTDNVTAGNETVNNVLSKVTMTDCISYIATNAGIKKMMVSPLDNNTVYDSVVIPPLGALKAIEHLDTYYGFYKNGAMYYFDFDKLYVLRYDGECTAYDNKQKQETCFMFPEELGESSDYMGSCSSDEAKDYVVVNSTNISVRNESVSNNAIVGNAVDSVDTYTGEVKSSKSTAETQGKTLSSTLNDKTENKYLTDIYQSQTNAQSTVMEMVLNDHDISTITPNKKFSTVFENSKYGGDLKGQYLVSVANTTLVKDGEDLAASSVVKIKRTMAT